VRLSTLLYRDEGKSFSCGLPSISPTLVEERTNQHEPDKLPGLSQFELPAFQTPVGAGLSLQSLGHPAVALRIL